MIYFFKYRKLANIQYFLTNIDILNADIILVSDMLAKIKMNLSTNCWMTAKRRLTNLKTFFVGNLKRKLEEIGCRKKRSKQIQPSSWADLRCDPKLLIQMQR